MYSLYIYIYIAYLPALCLIFIHALFFSLKQIISIHDFRIFILRETTMCVLGSYVHARFNNLGSLSVLILMLFYSLKSNSNSQLITRSQNYFFNDLCMRSFKNVYKRFKQQLYYILWKCSVTLKASKLGLWDQLIGIE